MSQDGISFGRWEIPESELDESFTTSGGPGGQHANRSETAVTLSFDIRASPLPHDLIERLVAALGSQTVTVTASESRSQWRNRAVARQRLAETLEKAAKPRRRRRRTKPTRASKRRRVEEKRRRVEEKRRRSETKRNRQPPRDW